MAFGFVKDGDIFCWTHRNIVEFLIKSQITFSETYTFPSLRMFWNTEYRAYFDWNREILLWKMGITINPYTPHTVDKTWSFITTNIFWIYNFCSLDIIKLLDIVKMLPFINLNVNVMLVTTRSKNLLDIFSNFKFRTKHLKTLVKYW